MKKATYGLIICGMLLNFESNGRNSEFSSTDNYSSADFSSDFDSDFAKFSESLAEFKKIKADLDSMKFSQKINELEKCITEISNILSGINHRQNRFQHQAEETEISDGKNLNKIQKSYYENQESVEIFEKNLRGFNLALQNPKTRFNTILNKGNKIFDNEKNKELFSPGGKIPSDLKNLFEQIYDTRYPEALKAWLEIKYMPSTDKKYDEKLNNFREKVELLFRYVQKIKTRTKSNKNSTAKNSVSTY